MKYFIDKWKFSSSIYFENYYLEVSEGSYANVTCSNLNSNTKDFYLDIVFKDKQDKWMSIGKDIDSDENNYEAIILEAKQFIEEKLIESGYIKLEERHVSLL